MTCFDRKCPKNTWPTWKSQRRIIWTKSLYENVFKNTLDSSLCLHTQNVGFSWSQWCWIQVQIWHCSSALIARLNVYEKPSTKRGWNLKKYYLIREEETIRFFEHCRFEFIWICYNIHVFFSLIDFIDFSEFDKDGLTWLALTGLVKMFFFKWRTLLLARFDQTFIWNYIISKVNLKDYNWQKI